MKRTCLVLILISLFQLGHSQVIRGIIKDKFSDAKISYATVYIDGTFAGTYSDQDGNFELDISKFNSMPLSISALGYNKQVITDFKKVEPLVIYLAPRTFELKEVIINSRLISRERKENLITFKKEFLGDTENGRNCVITNQEDIIFAHDPSGDTLKAYSSKPLMINNTKLGYKLSYFLNRFEYCKKDNYFLYEGSAVFNNDTIGDGSKKKAFERRRRYAYIGSRMQFFRELWKNNIDNSGYRIFSQSDDISGFNDIVTTQDDQKKYLYYNGIINISYYSRGASSSIKFMKKGVFFDQNGYFDPTGILWGGQMARLRIGDLLPFEYKGK